VERSLSDNFTPSRDTGIIVHGNISNDLLYYQLGVLTAASSIPVMWTIRRV
jgi:hypothetical protein